MHWSGKKTLSQQRHWCDKQRISTAQYFTRVGSEMQQNICSLECREEDESFFSAFPRVPFKHFLWHYQKCSSTPSHVSALWPIPCLRNGMRNTLQPLENHWKTIIKPQLNCTRSLTLATYIKGTMRSAAICFFLKNQFPAFFWTVLATVKNQLLNLEQIFNSSDFWC